GPRVAPGGRRVGGAPAGAAVLGPRPDRADQLPSRLLARTIRVDRQPRRGHLTHAAVHATARRRTARDGGGFLRACLAATGLQRARPAARRFTRRARGARRTGGSRLRRELTVLELHRGTRLLLRALHKNAQRSPLRGGAPARAARLHRRRPRLLP